MTNKLFVVLILFITWGGFGTMLANQPELPTRLVLTTNNDRELTIYSVNTSSEATLLYEFPPEFQISYDLEADGWNIRRAENIVASRNNQFVTFSAKQNQTFALFIVDLQSQQLEEIALPAYHLPVWSPDSTAIYLYCCESDNSGSPDSIDMIYELSQNQFIPFPTSIRDEISSLPSWLPDSSGFLLTTRNDEIQTLSRDTKTINVISDFKSIPLPERVYRNACDLTWSSRGPRLFFIVGCFNGGDDGEELIFTTDLKGNTKQLTRSTIPNLFPDEFNIWLNNIETSQLYEGVLLEVSSLGTGSLDGTGYYRILHLDLSGNLSTVFESESLDDIRSRLISPDETKILFQNVGRSNRYDGFLLVVDLATGKVVVDSELFSKQRACEPQWIDSKTILYPVEASGSCYVPSDNPVTLWTLDIDDQKMMPVKGLTGDMAYILPFKYCFYGDIFCDPQ